jgi:hypothetical protein
MSAACTAAQTGAAASGAGPADELTGARRRDAPAPRVIVTSDFPPLDVIPGRGCTGPAHRCSDPDDVQSMVRLLL